MRLNLPAAILQKLDILLMHPQTSNFGLGREGKHEAAGGERPWSRITALIYPRRSGRDVSFRLYPSFLPCVLGDAESSLLSKIKTVIDKFNNSHYFMNNNPGNRYISKFNDNATHLLHEERKRRFSKNFPLLL